VLDPAAAADITSVLAAVVDKHAMTPGRPAAGKTGTQQWGNTSDSQDAWMAGYTPELASVVWIGKATPGPIRDKRGKAIEGENLPAQIWKAFTQEALRGRPVTPLPRPAYAGPARALEFEPSAPVAERGGKAVPRDRAEPDPRDAGADADADARKKAAAAAGKSAPPLDASQDPKLRSTEKAAR
jgi:membrane peptidoglycan carboxypeptidase